LWNKYQRYFKIRKDLKVTANGTARTVTLSTCRGNPSDPGDLHLWHYNTRNIVTMRELGQALLDACDFVEASNPEWAGRASTLHPTPVKGEMKPPYGQKEK
jgi:hypothetical protein